MQIVNPLIFCASQKEDSRETTLIKSCDKFEPRIATICKQNNTESLPKIYNWAIDRALQTDVDCLILVHDDVRLDENPIPKLEVLFDSYDLVGVAGTSRINLTSPALWHIMGGGFGGGHLHGEVNHKVQEIYSSWENKTVFGHRPHRVVMLDGVFLALNRQMIESGVLFDEDCPSKFHMYDILFSLAACFKKMKIGVGDVNITHESPGLREFTEDWKSGEKYLFEKYAEYYGNILTV